ncbi:AraC-type DNA-binding protein [Leifsonia sp. 98AMF]|uniref:AraC family transcriptional regulator n=1 Tax=unclassified Leifsonia TaxID=2663824 RepID=UPI0008793F13|nr:MULTISPECIES: AraC family transcriptional regulator [unclassified Leifsonia]SDH21678.1 AraC-type DNA-binding protein [Leifsonia sp. 197AMF]SDJ16887.1 AraC-type DNA-binding protein [Leifsonia sp. 466MF]SDJ50489.1 AraC-type DNA-binding protein [Leifsonia sp. 157MF]SDN38330.1 AraC-type DNA-binding protein [Leifsonia sp. 509MF]SEM82859.1 AraC-type DNA-binding protein [Leifsonia sp. 467MF]
MSFDEFRALVAQHAPGGVSSTAIPGVVVSRMDHGGSQDESTTGTILAIVAQGTKRLSVGGTVHDYGAGQYLVASVDLPVSGHFTDATPEHPALGFGLELRSEVIAELMLTASAAEFPRPSRGESSPPAIAVGETSPRLLDATIRMLRLLDHPRDIPVLAPMIEREILWLIMSGDQGATVRQLGLADSSLSRVRHVVRWIREHFAEPLRVDELAERARMSPSAFHRAFHAVTSMSPIQYQKSIRLQEARLRLIANPGDIGATAYAVGYESPSQFSREYRREFGASPSEDAVALRGVARV